MNFPFYIARRYLFAKKSHNAINIISSISVTGVAVGTLALIVVLSVFNGFDKLIKSLFNSFDPDLLITLAEGKTFEPDSLMIETLRKTEGVYVVAEVLEENALITYNHKQHIATIKGVCDNYPRITGLDTMIIDGRFVLFEKNQPYALVGQGVAYYLSVGLHFINPLVIHVPRKGRQVSLNPETAFTKRHIFPSGIFTVEQEIDDKYVIVPLSFARELASADDEITALEIKIKPNARIKDVQSKIQLLLGESFIVKNRYQQKELFYRIMKYEKWAIFIILSFILAVASFNVIGSLTMLILEKKDDIDTLRSMGAESSLIRLIFLFEGWMISFGGALAGLALGLLICWVQIQFGIVRLGGGGSFIIDAYPVDVRAGDVFSVLLIVLAIGFLAAWYPVRNMSKKYLENV
jgi:lipoprotein-releasing system permease protein